MSAFSPLLRRGLSKAKHLLGRKSDHRVNAYSQEGEDLILGRIFEESPAGFYVDVGAHHPTRYSNTYFFYLKGWRGINIDAMPNSMNAFRRDRPRDINLEIAIASRSGERRTFHVFNEPALNTFDEALALERASGPYGHKIVARQSVVTQRLEDILGAQVPSGTLIDFMSVDVEGLDLEVLQSNDWQRFRPGYVLAECFGVPMSGLAAHPVTAFLATVDYVPFAKTVHTVIFRNAA